MTDEIRETDPPKPRRFPTAFTVLAIVLLSVWLLSFLIPSGTYELDPKSGGPVPGTYAELPECDQGDKSRDCVDKSIPEQLRQLWISIPNGLYGIENARGDVAPFHSGFLYGSAMIFLFVLAVGAFVSVTMRTEAIQTGIGRLALRFRHSGSILVIVLMSIFALGGTTYGMWEETLGFFALLVPLVLALNYDRLVAASIIFLGAGTGVLASTVNPFATGVASDAAGIEVGDGIVLRVLMFVVLVGPGDRLRAQVLPPDQPRSVPLDRRDLGRRRAGVARDLVEDVPQLTGRQKGILGVFFLAFAVMIYGFVPWADVMDTIFGARLALPHLRRPSTSPSPRWCSSSPP